MLHCDPDLGGAAPTVEQLRELAIAPESLRVSAPHDGIELVFQGAPAFHQSPMKCTMVNPWVMHLPPPNGYRGRGYFPAACLFMVIANVTTYDPKDNTQLSQRSYLYYDAFSRCAMTSTELGLFNPDTV